MNIRKRADSLTSADKLVRFGHILEIKEITQRIHPATGIKTVSVRHNLATVDYEPSAMVEICVS